ncbi:biotin--protein ligase-like isoform X1 [Daphnia pulex]|uniref:biotin--protein ligase-like isoform X1 n=1 Tax=Daphnia pulex TaxID=6669 RepID=UPI001EDDDD4B|nr:biotin--protein ligase-like isoform X1 [Daphnia pulex]XP_046437558.1 biotin--protein ligase-like isoform X1 [Daphnia pulex]XP_046437559.1 biotin--protein ligase-like isoform X1 [Daphnia pulex]XP_046437560.1 biotin--protein ligase-like isoform X1 [Daphnia pulex]XP_046437561.1 biotin--protein ligase-like isoform X1 [Daphnia pulex]XP_046437562.1 biotin--protein ligase-like isoform X1 [Daphnia pulex]XP_046437563.1 biotin--protein ligase-like isoform X1 [Daphnia pulex]XP_046437564.1 biotin--pr
MLFVTKIAGVMRPVERLLASSARPPNILICTSDKEVFQQYRALFESTLEPDCYALYHLDELSFRSKKAWLSNTSLLVLASRWSDNDLHDPLEEYIKKGGQCLSLHPFSPKWLNGTQVNGVTKYVSDQGLLVSPVDKLDFAQVLPHILELHFHIKTQVKSQQEARIESQQMVGHLIAEPYHQEAFFRNFGRQSPDMMTVELTKSFSTNKQEPPINIRRNQSSRFNQRDYFDMLKTKVLGRTGLYFDVVGSTHSVLEGCDSFPDGLVVIARRQSQGRGRSGNVWMSPEGCAMFSLRMRFPLQSELGRHLPLLQHIVALAIVLAAKGLPHCHELQLGVKWPNDVYHQDVSRKMSTKIGGVLVTTSIMGSIVMAAIGCGVNLNNQRPTLCLNDLIRQVGETRPLSLEHFLAAVFNQLENLVDSISCGRLNQVLALYHQHWLHSKGTEVTVLTADDETVTAQILGIDEHGFLRVQPREGPSITVHPDGNSFDMLNGLLVPKLIR